MSKHCQFSCRNNLKQPTEDLLKISTYYLFFLRFCNAYEGNEKGHVEKSVEFVGRKSIYLDDRFDSLEYANKHLATKIQQLNGQKSDGHELTNSQRFESELKHLNNLPVAPYDFAVSQCYKV